MNKTILVGNLCAAPELRYTAGGDAVCDLRIATNEKWTSKSGEKKEETMFIKGTLWGKAAENAAQYLHKGSKVAVDGKLKLETWEDKDSGAKRSKHTLSIRDIEYLTPKGADAEGD